MPILKNPKHERFAQALAKGKTQAESYAAAGYKHNDSNASRLTGNEQIVARIAELQGRGAERAAVTVETLLREAEEVRVAAMADGQFAAAIAAIREKGVLSGKRIERAELGDPGEFDRMSDEELKAALREGLAHFDLE